MNVFCASTAADWRAWLVRHSQSEVEVWLVIQHKGSGVPSVRYHEAIDQALCYGWIDSHARSRDADSSYLRFTPRTPRSRWSRLNRERAARMTEQGLMTAAGQAAIDRARATGRWQVEPTGPTPGTPGTGPTPATTGPTRGTRRRASR